MSWSPLPLCSWNGKQINGPLYTEGAKSRQSACKRGGREKGEQFCEGLSIHPPLRPQSKRLDTPTPGPFPLPSTYSPSSCHKIPSWPCLPTYLLGPGPKSAAETEDPTLSPFSRKILAVILAQHSTCCVALGKSLSLSEPQLPLESNVGWAGAPKSFHFGLAASIPVSSSVGIKCLTVLGKPDGLVTRGVGCTSP